MPARHQIEASCPKCLSVNKVELPKKFYNRVNIQCYRCEVKFPWQIKKRTSRIIAVDDVDREKSRRMKTPDFATISEEELSRSEISMSGSISRKIDTEPEESLGGLPRGKMNFRDRATKAESVASYQSTAGSELSDLSRVDRASVNSAWSTKSRKYKIDEQILHLPKPRRLSRVEVTECCTYCTANNLVEVPTKCKSVTVECCVCRSHFQVKPPTHYQISQIRTERGPDALTVSTWTVKQVGEFLNSLGTQFRKYVKYFEDDRINGEQFLSLSVLDLRKLQIISPLHQKRLLDEITYLKGMDALSGAHKKETVKDLQKERSRLTKRAFGAKASNDNQKQDKYSSRKLNFRSALNSSARTPINSNRPAINPNRTAPQSRGENIDVISKEIGKLFDNVDSSHPRKSKIGPGPLDTPNRNLNDPSRIKYWTRKKDKVTVRCTSCSRQNQINISPLAHLDIVSIECYECSKQFTLSLSKIREKEKSERFRAKYKLIHRKEKTHLVSERKISHDLAAVEDIIYDD